jgi:AraC-like DNA-binding protein
MDYMSVREAAVNWGISERRVHKLCQEKRISGLIRLGNAWGIPMGAGKPNDERAKPIPKADPGRLTSGWLGSDASLSFQRDGVSVYQLENDTGNGIVTIYDVFPGIRLFYADLHLSEIANSGPVSQGAEILEINHCREGRFECELIKGEFAYMGEGDLSANLMSAKLSSSRFPLKHYHGVSIVIDISEASVSMEELTSALGIRSINLFALRSRLFAQRQYFILRGTDSIAHIFSELYNAPDSVKESYIRLKILELFLFLNLVDLDSGDDHRYFYKTRIDAVKAMREYLVEHLEEQFTLEDLSSRFGIPLTAMKTCFKSVYGSPIHAYMQEYRIQAAAVMLRQGALPVADIAAAVGYDSHAKFSSIFRSAMGVTPSDYRKVVVQME